jgi:hypothetical protein
MYKRFGILFLATVFGTLCLGLSDRLPGTADYTLVSSAHAIVGRPLTPVSVAGVARRTARRCAVGVYNC